MAVLVKPLLPEDIKEKVLPEIEKLAKKVGGTVTIREEWGKKHLAYPIKGHEEGYYLFEELVIDPAQVSRFEREMKLIRDILRVIVILEEDKK